MSSTKYARLIGWLIATRQARGLTIRDVAQRLDVVPSAVHRIENLERRLDVYEYVQYCAALELDPQEGIRMLR